MAGSPSMPDPPASTGRVSFGVGTAAQMKVTPVHCGPFVNESERKAFEQIKSRLISVPGDGEWLLLTNLAFSATHRLQSDEIDVVAIGPPGVRVPGCGRRPRPRLRRHFPLRRRRAAVPLRAPEAGDRACRRRRELRGDHRHGVREVALLLHPHRQPRAGCTAHARHRRLLGWLLRDVARTSAPIARCSPWGWRSTPAASCAARRSSPATCASTTPSPRCLMRSTPRAPRRW